MTAGPALHVPRDRHYDRTHHLWALRDEGSRHVRIGMDSLGLSSLGDLAYVSLAEAGTRVQRGDPIGTLEAAKMATTIAAPVSGTIVRRNDEVLKDPLRVNAEPYGSGWLVEIDPGDWEREAMDLVSGAGIDEWAAAEAERLRSETD